MTWPIAARSDLGLPARPVRRDRVDRASACSSASRSRVSVERAPAAAATAQQLDDQRVPDGVEHRRPVLAGGHQPGPAQHAELLRQMRRLDAHERLQLTDRRSPSASISSDPDRAGCARALNSSALATDNGTLRSAGSAFASRFTICASYQSINPMIQSMSRAVPPAVGSRRDGRSAGRERCWLGARVRRGPRARLHRDRGAREQRVLAGV